jgi:hypothetical protein
MYEAVPTRGSFTRRGVIVSPIRSNSPLDQILYSRADLKTCIIIVWESGK